jgi:aspartate/methionine/tyrosine aminotransferase
VQTGGIVRLEFALRLMSTGRHPHDALFDAPDYTSWCRALYRLPPGRPKPLVLFESTIAEPTELLRGVIESAFSPRVSDRFESVFGSGNPYLVEALAARYRVRKDQIVCTTGASNAISMILRALAPDGARVLVETPHLDLIEALPAGLGAKVSAIQRRGADYDIDPTEFAEALKGGAKLALITNPHNPSGAWLKPERIKELAAIAEAAGAHLVVDEIYADFAPGSRRTTAAALAPNIIAVNSLTKVYGLFSLRCGWLIASPETAKRVETANARLELGVSKLAHAVAAHVLEDVKRFDDHWRGILEQTRPVVEKHASAMIADGLIEGELPATGCMYFPRLVDHADTHAFARGLWEETGLLLAPGEFFGQAGHVRIGFGAVDASLDRGLSRLHEALLAHRRGGAARGKVARKRQ